MDLEPSFPARFSSRVGEVSQCPSDHISSRACPRLVHPHASTARSPTTPLDTFAFAPARLRVRRCGRSSPTHRRPPTGAPPGRRRREGLASTGGRSRGRGRGAGGDAPARAPTRARPPSARRGRVDRAPRRHHHPRLLPGRPRAEKQARVARGCQQRRPRARARGAATHPTQAPRRRAGRGPRHPIPSQPHVRRHGTDPDPEPESPRALRPRLPIPRRRARRVGRRRSAAIVDDSGKSPMETEPVTARSADDAKLGSTIPNKRRRG